MYTSRLRTARTAGGKSVSNSYKSCYRAPWPVRIYIIMRFIMGHCSRARRDAAVGSRARPSVVGGGWPAGRRGTRRNFLRRFRNRAPVRPSAGAAHELGRAAAAATTLLRERVIRASPHRPFCFFQQTVTNASRRPTDFALSGGRYGDLR